MYGNHPMAAQAANVETAEDQTKRERRWRLNEVAGSALNTITNLGQAEDVLEVAKVLQAKAAEVLSRPL